MRKTTSSPKTRTLTSAASRSASGTALAHRWCASAMTTRLAASTTSCGFVAISSRGRPLSDEDFASDQQATGVPDHKSDSPRQQLTPRSPLNAGSDDEAAASNDGGSSRVRRASSGRHAKAQTCLLKNIAQSSNCSDPRHDPSTSQRTLGRIDTSPELDPGPCRTAILSGVEEAGSRSYEDSGPHIGAAQSGTCFAAIGYFRASSHRKRLKAGVARINLEDDGGSANFQTHPLAVRH